MGQAAAEALDLWGTLDIKAISQGATEQGLHLETATDNIHFLAAMYESWNELLLNMLCKPDHQFAEQCPAW